MLKLYDHPLSPYAQKVRIALTEKGVPFTLRTPEATARMLENHGIRANR